MVKIVRWLVAISLGILVFKGLTTDIKVEASTVGQLTREGSSLSGRMEFRHPQGTQNTWEDYIILKINGEVVFCLDPTVYAYVGEYIGEEFKDVEQITQRIQIDSDLRQRLMFITYYGYQKDPTHRNYHYTQALIWETLGYNAVSFTGGLSMDEYQGWKAIVLNEVNAHQTLASFNNQSFTIKVGESITLTDTHNVLQNLTIPASENGYNFTRQNNQLTITATKDAVDGKVTFNQPRDNRIHGSSIVFRKPGSQTVASLKLRDPQSASVNLSTLKHTKMIINKTSSATGEALSDVEFTLYDAITHAVVKTAVTNTNGVAEFLDLEADRQFYFKETRAKNGYMLNETRYDYTAVAGETKTFDVKNTPVPDPLLSSRATTLTGGKQGNPTENHQEVVTITQLQLNETYRLVSAQYNADTHQELSTQETTFTANGTTHEHTFRYTVPTGFEGRIVYGAKLYKNGQQVADHTDMDNRNQTVTVVEDKPLLSSNATTTSGHKQGNPTESHQEVVTINQLTKGQTYRLVSAQYNADTTRELNTQEKTFTANGTTYEHTFQYTVPAGFEGRIVYGAKLYKNGQQVADHTEMGNVNQTVTVINPKVVTEATTVKGEKVGYAYEDHKEIATLTNLIPNREYEVVATQYDEKGKAYASQTAKFTAKESTYTHEFTFSVPKGFIGHLVYGETVSYNGQVIATHYDLNNKNQTVEIIEPNVTTQATTEKGEKVGYHYEDHKEVAQMTGLIIGRHYKVVATQYDETGKVYATQEREFKATQTKQTEVFTFKVPVSFTGTIVYGEDLYSDGKKIATHYDLKSIPQSVKVIKPIITTQATTVKGAKVGYAYEDHKELATLTNLIPNREYEVVATQYDQNGKAYASQTAKFTAKESTYTHEFTFSVPKGFIGHLVYGETVSYNGQVIATHYDLNNKNQTVEIIEPKVTTQATTEKGEKVGYVYEDHKEVAQMTGLIIGRHYKVVATQYDETGKVYATQEREFTATQTKQTEIFKFKVPVSFTGTIVYGEDLYSDGKKIATHYDLKSIPQSLKVVKPTITTQATTVKGAKVGYAYEDHKEVATLTNLIPNREYEVVATQYDQNGKAYASQTAKFTAKESTYTHEFIFSVPKGFIGHLVYGETVSYNGQVIATHYDLNNKNQTVEIIEPNVTTQATTVSGGKVDHSYENHKEIAIMTNLIVGKTYKVVATQYNAQGKVLGTQEREFTAKATEHNEEFIFSVPTGYVGDIVYGEDLYEAGNKVAVHYDLTNKNQTVTVIEPKVVTQATTITGGKVGHPYENHKELATMTNLIVGKTYKVVATQYDSQGKVLGTQEREFVADNTTHTEEFIFSVPTGYTGDIVYGEDLYEAGNKVSVHYDLTNKNQTVTVIEPKVVTEATTITGGKVGHPYENHKELATLTNLIPNREYEVVATQYDEKGKAYASQTAKFTAKESTYTHEFTFSVPKGFIGHLVYGETVSYNGQVIAKHYDLNNKNQTVEIIEPNVTTQATTEKGEKVGYHYEDHKEVAQMTGLIIGRRYKVVATQYDETGKVYATKEREFKATQTKQTEVFTFKVPVSFTGTIVYGEDLYSDGKKIATHYDLKSIPQSVKVIKPTIGTVAKAGDKKELVKGQNVTVTDTLTYANFKNEVVAVKTWVVKYGTDEKVSEVYTRIVKLDGNGEVTITLDNFDTSKLVPGKYTLMEQVFEVKDGKVTEQLITEHVDNQDEKQTFKVTDPQLPEMGNINNTMISVMGMLLVTFSGVLIFVKR